MTANLPEPPLLASRAARLTLVMSCLYAATGVILVFLPRWLAGERGLSGAEIGVVLSSAQLARIVVGPAIAFWADGHADRRTPLRVIAPIAVAAYCAFFLVARDFGSLLALGFLALTLTQAMAPLVESATLRATTSGRISYGFARGVGSLAFIIANVAGGVLIARFGLGAVVVWILTCVALVAASSWFALKPDASLVGPHLLGREARTAAVRALLGNRRFITLIVSCGLIQAAHGFYYGFSTLVWRGQGITPDIIGLLWGFGVAVEVLFLWNLHAFEKRMSPEVMILVGAVGSVVRWALLGFAPIGFWLWPLQALHAFSFTAAHVGAMRLLARETPENAAAMAQTLYAALSSGLLLGGASLMSGVLYDAIGARGYWAMSVIALVGGALALGLLAPGRPARPQPR